MSKFSHQNFVRRGNDFTIYYRILSTKRVLSILVIFTGFDFDVHVYGHVYGIVFTYSVRHGDSNKSMIGLLDHSPSPASSHSHKRDKKFRLEVVFIEILIYYIIWLLCLFAGAR